MKKFISISLAITTTLWLVGTFVIYAPVAKAAVIDGDIVSPDATFVDADGNTYYPYDVFIVKIVGTKTFKRLILNPQVFDSYGHLKWSNIKKISAATVAGYTAASLVRAIDDTKVYKLSPNGDTGTKQWVETLACFTSKAYDWDSVYIINATDRDNYTTGASICGGGAAEGPINLSLASDNPIAATLPQQAQGITFLKVKLDGTGTINQLTVTRKGAGDVDDFGDIYIYKDGVRLTSGRALSSATSKVTFINLGIAAPATFEIVADLTGTPNAGNVNYFAIDASSDVTGTGTVGGVYPITGNPMGTSGSTAGTITVYRSGSTARNVTIGDKEVEITQFKITTATEGAYVKRIKLFNNGTADNNLITNLKLKDNATATTVATATSLNSAGYADFVLSTPYYIKKGDNQIFRVYADIGATKPDRTIKLYLELATDVLATGNIYGYGMKATITDGSSTGLDSTYYITVTCKGGDLTLNKLGPNATKIGTTALGVDFLDFSVAAAADITIKRTRLMYCEDEGGDGTYDTYASYSAGASNDIENIEIVDKDSGAIIAGPKDGTAFNDGNVTSGCATSVNSIYEDFTDTIDLTAGTTKTYSIKADVKTSNTGSTRDVASGSKLKFILYSYATLVTSSGTVNYMKYADTSDAVPGTAIAPSGHIAGEEMTVQSSSLTLSLAADPSGSSAGGTYKTYIKGQSGVTAVGIIFTASNASPITINSITLTAYTAENTGTRAGKWVAGVDTNYVKDSIGNVYIYDKGTSALIPGSTAKGFSGDTSELVEYTGLNWVIPAGDSKTLLVKSDISSASPASASTADTFIAFDIEGTSDVTAVDNDGNSVTLGAAGGTTTNGGSTTDASVAPSVDFGIAKYGSLAVTAASDTPDKAIVIMGTSDNEISKFKLTATNEGWLIDKYSVVLIDGDTAYTPDAANGHSENFTALKLKYQTQSQFGTSNWTISSGKTFGSTASLSFSFSGTDRIYVPKDDATYVTVLASINGYNGGQGAASKVPFRLSTISGGTSSFEAYGAQSGEQLYDFAEPSAAGFNLQFTARSKPVFAKSAWSGGELELARFTITAVGYDVVFAGNDDTLVGQIGSAALKFDVIASSTDDATGGLTMYDWNENVIASAPTVTWGAGSGTSVSFQFGSRDTTVPLNTTKEFHVDLSGSDLSDFPKTDEYVYLQLKNDKGGNLATGWDTTAYQLEDNVTTCSWDTGNYNVVWNDGTNEEGISGQGYPDLRYGMPSLIKNVGPLPITFRTLRGTTAP